LDPASITITLTRYREPDWLLNATLESLSRQRHIDADVLFLDQSHDPRAERYCRELSTDSIRFKRIEIPDTGLSHARNCGIERCETAILLFIDPDAVAEPDWGAELAGTLSRSNVAIAGGRIVPRWHKRPLLITRSWSAWAWARAEAPASRASSVASRSW
jgi:GT2 family glycosyltransferase